jgi:hypothetical protein
MFIPGGGTALTEMWHFKTVPELLPAADATPIPTTNGTAAIAAPTSQLRRFTRTSKSFCIEQAFSTARPAGEQADR